MSSLPPFPRLQRGKLITAGLVGCWRFYEGSGLITHDVSGNENHGQLVGPTWAGEFDGHALRFDGVNDYVNAKMGTISNAASWMARVKTNELSSNQYVMDMGTNRGTISILNGKMATIPTGGPTGGYIQNVGVELRDGKWNHLATTQNNAIQTAYINGVAVFAISNALISSLSTIRIGAYYPLAYFFAGIIDDVRIYNRVLSAPEIALIYAGHG